MPVTHRQRHLLDNLEKITSHKKLSGARGYFLAGEECTSTINSLIVKSIIRKSPDQQRLHWIGLVSRAT